MYLEMAICVLPKADLINLVQKYHKVHTVQYMLESQWPVNKDSF
jgi:hypothetical protein